MRPSLRILFSLFILTISLFVNSCKEENITNYLAPENSGTPDVNIIYSKYSLGTIHSTRLDTSSGSYYNYTVNLDLTLDKPENRSQINKMVITNGNGYGWELYNNELEKFYEDSIKGYKIKNLIFISQSSNSSSYTVRLYSRNNAHGNDFQFLLTPIFSSSFSINGSWYTENKYLLTLNYMDSLNNWKAEITWLTEKKEVISKKPVSAADLANNRYIYITDMPANAVYYYLDIDFSINNIRCFIYSMAYRIAERFPSNIKVLEESQNFELNNYYQIGQRLILSDSYNNLLLYSLPTMMLEKNIKLNIRPLITYYSEFNKRIYYTTENRRLYSIGLNESTPRFERSYQYGVYGMISVDKFLVLQADQYEYSRIEVVNLETDSISSYPISSNSYYYTKFIYNEKKNVIYGLSDYSNILRFQINSQNGQISGLQTKSLNSNSNEAVLYPDGSKLLCRDGKIYTCSNNAALDLIFYEDSPIDFNKAVITPDNSYIITLNNNSSNPLLAIYSLNSKLLKSALGEFYGNPLSVLMDGDKIIVISRSTDYPRFIFSESYSYSELISNGKVISIPRETYFQMRKIN